MALEAGAGQPRESAVGQRWTASEARGGTPWPAWGGAWPWGQGEGPSLFWYPRAIVQGRATLPATAPAAFRKGCSGLGPRARAAPVAGRARPRAPHSTLSAQPHWTSSSGPQRPSHLWSRPQPDPCVRRGLPAVLSPPGTAQLLLDRPAQPAGGSAGRREQPYHVCGWLRGHCTVRWSCCGQSTRGRGGG